MSKVLGKGDRKVNMVSKCLHICANAKILPVESTSEMGGKKG
jgi:hypothetical protein